MLVTEFMDGAEEIGDAEIDDQIIDEGLALVRRLWDAGLAHRDIKPANLLVVDGHLVLIDVAFAQVRPSPWRQAVDLANMMLVLAVRTDAPRVYDRALRYFSPDEIAEAFAAARGVASPSQLRSVLDRDGRDLVDEFRLLGPARAPISLQRWGPRRVVLAAAIAAFAVIAAINVASMVAPAELPMTDTPACGTNNTMILMAQAVPSAHAIPCVDALPPGWSIGGISVQAADAQFWLDSDRYGSHAVQIRLRSADRCRVERTDELNLVAPGWQPSESAASAPSGRTTRTFVSGTACITYEFVPGVDGATIATLDSTVEFQPRTELVAEVHRRSGLALCGAGSSRCTDDAP